jgi:hypothetical protein
LTDLTLGEHLLRTESPYLFFSRDCRLP